MKITISQESSEFQPKDPGYEARVRSSFARQKFLETLAAELVSVRPGQVEIKLPYRESLTQQDKYLHAGAIATIADTACGYAALSLANPESEVLTVEYKVNLMAPAVGDHFVARGRVIKPGKTITFCSGEVFSIKGKREKLVVTMLASIMHHPKAPPPCT